MRLRADVTFDASNNMIQRSGITYGPEGMLRWRGIKSHRVDFDPFVSHRC